MYDYHGIDPAPELVAAEVIVVYIYHVVTLLNKNPGENFGVLIADTNNILQLAGYVAIIKCLMCTRKLNPLTLCVLSCHHIVMVWTRATGQN